MSEFFKSTHKDKKIRRRKERQQKLMQRFHAAIDTEEARKILSGPTPVPVFVIRKER